MKTQIKNITVLGDGGWGTTLAIYLANKKYAVTIWGAFKDNIERIKKTHLNERYLPGFVIPNQIYLTDDIHQASVGSDLIILATPSQYLSSVLKQLKVKTPILNKKFLSVIKGIDTNRLLRVSESVYSILGPVSLAVLSGPTIASELASRQPTTAVIASINQALAKELQQIFNSEVFRIYLNKDVIGIELAGSIKNVIAIACGVCDGLGFGTNAKSALLTRGLAEMARLGQALGGKTKTFYGLAGLGDLVTTCVNPKSRNRSVGESLGQGKSIKVIKTSTHMVAEGVETVSAIYKLSKRHQIPMPICHEVYKIIYQGKSASKAVADLMGRTLKIE